MTVAAADNTGLGYRKVRLVRIAHVYYTHKGIEKACEFLEDFGFREVKRVGTDIYYRGTGSEPFVYCARGGDKDEFGGAAFVVESEQDLEYASQTLPNATKVYDLSNAPGGGRCVTFYDPVDNFPFHLVCGQTPAQDVTALPQLKFNFVCRKNNSSLSLASSLMRFSSEKKSQRKNTDRETRPSGFRKVSGASKPPHELTRDGPLTSDQRLRSCAGAQAGSFWHVRDGFRKDLRILHHQIQLCP